MARQPNTDAPLWRQHAICNRNGQPYPILANVLTALREADDFTGFLAFNEMLGVPMVKALPGVVDFGDPRPICDNDLTLIQERLQRIGLITIGTKAVHQAVETVAMEQSYHPVVDYLDQVAAEWDGKSRLETMFLDYFGAKRQDREYLAQVGKMFMIGMVARIDRPGCKNDTMLMLEGPQGSKKSTACEILAGEWYSDCLPDLIASGKDVSIHLRGKWLIEIAEMNALRGASDATVKAFVSRKIEQFRPVWGKTEDYQPRQCVFVGTTNQLNLKDPTGGRRYWPIRCGHIDIEALARDRDQLFAEAAIRYKAGEKHYPTDHEFERMVIKAEQDALFEPDVWEDMLCNGFLEMHDKVTISMCLNQIGFTETKDMGTREQRRVTAILTRLGWTRGKRSNKNRWWYKPGIEEDDAD